MGTKGNVYGEGNYDASRQYNDATKKFVEARKVEEAALLRAKDSPPPVREPSAPAPAVGDPRRERKDRSAIPR